MAIVVNSNIASLTAQQNLSSTQQALAMNLSHLSSGLRVATAADDSAGLAISEGLRAQVSSLSQASRNAQDGISLTQVAEGGLAEIGSILGRMRQLAVQASSGSLQPSDRDHINSEYKSLRGEIDRIAKVTNFNGIKMLDGSTSKVDLQVGSNNTTDDVLTVDVLAGGSHKQLDFTADAAAGAVGAAGTLTFTVGSDTTSVDYLGTDNVQGVADKINKNSLLADAGVSASAVYDSSTGKYALRVSGNSSLSSIDDTGTTGSFGGEQTASTPDAFVSAKSTNIGYAGSKYLSAADLTDATTAQDAIDNVTQAIQDVASMRANLGTMQNRLNSTINNLASEVQSFSAADSRIRDVDVAQETAQMTRNQILVQAGVAVLAQANQMPSVALSLLK